MLPEHERRTLREIEAKLREADPQFTENLTADHRARSQRWEIILVLADVTAVTLLVVGVFAGRVWPVLWAFAGGALLLWIHVARRKAARRGS